MPRTLRDVIVGTTLVGLAGALTASAAQAQATFTVDVDPDSTSGPRGGSATYTVTVAPSGGAFTEVVTLSCLGNLAGATCSFSPASVTPDPSAQMSTLTISPAVTTAPGPLTFIIAGTSAGGTIAGTLATLVVTDFSVTVNPGAQSVVGGSPATYAVNLTPHPAAGRFDEVITLSCGPGLPAGSACAFDPAAVTPGSAAGASVLTVSTAPITAGVRRIARHAAGPASAHARVLAAVVLAIVLLGTMGLGGRALPRWRLGVAAAVILLLGPACGSDEPTNPGPPPVNGTFDVIGTAGNLIHFMTVTITINP